MGTLLNNVATWATKITSPNPGEPVRAGGGAGTPITIAGAAGLGTTGDLTYTALVSGVRIRHLGGISQALLATVTGNDVSVQLGTDGAGAVTSTAAAVKAEVDAKAAALVTTVSGGTGLAGIYTPWVSLSAGILGSIRKGLQDLANRTYAMVRGQVSFRALQVNGAAAPADASALADGHLDVSGDVAVGNDLTVANNATVSVLLTATQGLFGALLGATRLDGARVLWTAVGSGVSNGNPPRGTALTNDLRPLTLCKTWARLTTDGANGFTLVDGANVFAASFQVGNLLRFAFGAALADTNYACVVSGINSGTGAPVSVGAINQTTTHVDVSFPADPRGTAYDISLLLFGRQNS